MQSLLHDLRFAGRLQLRQRSLAIASVLTLALGMGGNLALFAALDALLLRALPVREPERLVAVVAPASFSQRDLAILRERQHGLSGLAGYSGWRFTMVGSGAPRSLDGAKVSGELFSTLGARAAAGRLIGPADVRPGAPAVALISYGLWQRLGGEVTTIGGSIRLDGRPVTVVGVAAPDLEFPAAHTDVWRPLVADPASEDYRTGYLTLVGRLRPGIATAAAASDLRQAASALREEGEPEREPPGKGWSLRPLGDFLLGATRERLLLLQVAVAFVLLIACANIASLQLTGVASRRGELSLRHALGARRSRLARQLLTESVVVALAGAAAATGVACVAVRALRGALPPELPGVAGVAVTPPVLAAGFALALSCGLLFGSLPTAWALRRLDDAPAEGARTSARRGQRRVLAGMVVVEIALGMVLVTAAALMLQSFWRLSHERSGFAPRGVLTLEVEPAEAALPTDAQVEQFWDSVVDGVRALPGITAAGAIHILPFSGNNWNPGLEVAGADPGQAGADVNWRVATPGYFAAAGIPLLRGRGFGPRDGVAAEGVAVVNETLARRLFPGGDALGHEVRTAFEQMRAGEGKPAWVRIVGVVGDTRDMTLGQPPTPQMYRPLAQWPITGMTLMVRTAADPAAFASAVRQQVWAAQRDTAISNVQPFTEVLRGAVAQPRLLAALLTVFGTLAAAMGAVGVYGVLAFAVAQRRRELAIRAAVGASAGTLFRHVLAGALSWILAGVLLGGCGALAATRLLAGQLHAVSPDDPRTLLVVAAALAAAGLAAALAPARAAGRTAPATLLAG